MAANIVTVYYAGMRSATSHLYIRTDNGAELVFGRKLAKLHRVGWAYHLEDLGEGRWKVTDPGFAEYHPTDTREQVEELQHWAERDAAAHEEAANDRFIKHMKADVRKRIGPMADQYRRLDSRRRRELMYLVVMTLTGDKE